MDRSGEAAARVRQVMASPQDVRVCAATALEHALYEVRQHAQRLGYLAEFELGSLPWTYTKDCAGAVMDVLEAHGKPGVEPCLAVRSCRFIRHDLGCTTDAP